MAIALRSQGTIAENTSAGTTLNVPYPSPIASTDVLVLMVSGSVVGLPTLPAGFTQVYLASSTGSTTSPSLMLAIKKATGAETGNLAVTTPSSVSIGQLIAFSGVDLNTLQDTTATTIDQSTASLTSIIPSLTTTISGAALVYAGASASAASTATPPSSPATFTETADRGAGTRSATMGYLLWQGVGATGTVTITWTVSIRSIAVLMALRPGVAAQPLRTSLRAVAHAANW